MKAVILIIAGCLSLPSICHAQAVKLERKYRPGDKVLVNAKQEITQKLNLGGREDQTKVSSVSVVAIETGKPNEKGHFQRTHSIQKMMRSFEGSNGKLVFDSTKPDAADASSFPGAEQILEAMKAAKKIKKIYQYDKSNKLLAAATAGIDIKTLPLGMREEISPAKLKKTRLQELAILPLKPVAPGDSWEHKSELTLGAGQSLKLVTKYTYKGQQELKGTQYDYIESEVVKADLVAAEAPAGLPQLSESNVKPVKSMSKIWFDREAGRVAASTDHVQIVGTITLSFGGQSLDGEIDFTIDTEMKSGAESKTDNQ
ncbi:MAG: hypothetical protein AB8G99_13330 [Planctomycetaceae bacterium]